MKDERPTHLDLFSGLGGFSIAAQWAGFRTVAFCEKEERCRAFLKKTWGLPVEPDIRQLDGTRYRGVTLLTGGPPCQPASRAGKQGGEGDDRWLWPEALRVLAEAKPDCVVFENPPGIYDVGIDGILSEMERSGYAVQPFDIPACSVDSPQLRYRVWIVGFLADTNGVRRMDNGLGIKPAIPGDEAQLRNGQRTSQGVMASTRCKRSGQDKQERQPQGRDVSRRDCANDLAQPYESGLEESTSERRNTGAQCQAVERSALRQWNSYVWVPCADGKLRRAPDQSLNVAHGLHRSILVALGNSIVPQVAYEILRAIRQSAK